MAEICRGCMRPFVVWRCKWACSGGHPCDSLKSRHCGSNDQRYLHSVSKTLLSLGVLACHGRKCPGLHCAECHHDFIAGEWAWGQRGQPGHCPVATTHAAGAERAQSQQAAGQAPLLDSCFQGCSSCPPIKLPRPDAFGAAALCSLKQASNEMPQHKQGDCNAAT